MPMSDHIIRLMKAIKISTFEEDKYLSLKHDVSDAPKYTKFSNSTYVALKANREPCKLR